LYWSLLLLLLLLLLGHIIYKSAGSDKILLLSPACRSAKNAFNQFV